MDKKSITNNTLECALAIEYIDDELIRLGLKNPKIIKTVKVNPTDLLDFVIITKDDMHKFLIRDELHNVNDCKCGTDDECINNRIMKMVYDFIWTNNTSIISWTGEIDVGAIAVIESTQTELQCIIVGDYIKKYIPMHHSVYPYEDLSITYLTDGSLSLSGLLYLNFNNYKQIMYTRSRRQNEDKNTPIKPIPIVSMPKWHQMGNTIYRICPIKHHNITSKYMILRINITGVGYNNSGTPYGSCMRNIIIRYRIEIINHMLILKTYGSIYADRTNKLKYSKGLDMQYINDQNSNGGCINWNNKPYSITNLVLHLDKNTSTINLPFHVLLDNVKLS